MRSFTLSVTSIAAAVAFSTHLVVEAQSTKRMTNKGGGIVCFSEASYKEFTRAALHAKDTKDSSWMQSMLTSQQCLAVKRGLRYTIKDFGYLGVSEIYLHPPGGGAPVTVWTANENL